MKNIVKRQYRQHLLTDHKSFTGLDVLPDRYHQTLVGQIVLIYDSKQDNYDGDTVFVIATRGHLELRSGKGDSWFIDGTFNVYYYLFCARTIDIYNCFYKKNILLVSSNMISRVFTILDFNKPNVGFVDVLSFVYALLSLKESERHTTVFRTVEQCMWLERIKSMDVGYRK